MRKTEKTKESGTNFTAVIMPTTKAVLQELPIY
jgi:hypothetical protein